MKSPEIEETINGDYEKFLNQPYSGTGSVPKNLVDIFKKAVFALPPYYHKINFTKIKGIVLKDASTVTHGEINEIFKLVFNTPLEKMFDSVEVAIPEMVILEKFAVTFNSTVDNFQKQLQGKSSMLQSLSSGVLNSKGMRIITD